MGLNGETVADFMTLQGKGTDYKIQRFSKDVTSSIKVIQAPTHLIPLKGSVI